MFGNSFSVEVQRRKKKKSRILVFICFFENVHAIYHMQTESLTREESIMVLGLSSVTP